MQRRREAAQAGFRNDPDTALAALDDTDPHVRAAGLRSLARLDALTVTHLDTALADGTETVRLAALELAAPRTEPSLTALLDDQAPAVVEMAAWAVGERVDDQAPPIDRLSELADTHDDPLVREAAVAALGSLGHDDGLPAVLRATRDKPAIRRRAVLALAAFDGPEVDEAWERARTDNDRQVRDAVDELLGPADDS